MTFILRYIWLHFDMIWFVMTCCKSYGTEHRSAFELTKLIPYLSLRASYRVTIVSIFKKFYHVIMDWTVWIVELSSFCKHLCVLTTQYMGHNCSFPMYKYNDAGLISFFWSSMPLMWNKSVVYFRVWNQLCSNRIDTAIWKLWVLKYFVSDCFVNLTPTQILQWNLI